MPNGKFKLGCGQVARDIGVIERFPSVIQVFVRQIGSRSVGQPVEPVVQERVVMRGEIAGLFVAQTVDQLAALPDLRLTSANPSLALFQQQSLHQRHAGPFGQDVIADINQPARFKVAA